MGLRHHSGPRPAKDLTPGAPQNFVAYAASSTVFVLTWQEDPNRTLPDDFDLDYSIVSATGPWTSIPMGLSYTYNHTGQDVTVRHWWRLVAKHAGFASNSTITTAIAYRPVFTVAPTSYSLPSIGGDIQFTATDIDNPPLEYILSFSYRGDITINSTTGLVHVPAAAVGTTGNIRVTARDGIGLTTETLNCAVTVATAGARKWNPGHYMFIHNRFDQANRFAMYNKPDFKNNPNIKGACISVRWAQVESDTRGVYSGFTRPAQTTGGTGYAAGTYGITWLRAELDFLAAMGKWLVVRCYDKVYDSTNFPTGIFPSYLHGTYTYWTPYSGILGILEFKRYDATAMSYYIDMWNAYGAVFDSQRNPSYANNQYFEMVTPFQESAFNVDTVPPAGYSESALNNQYRLLAQGMRNACPSTNVWMEINWSPWGYITPYFEYCRSIKVGVGNPDTSVPAWGNVNGMEVDQIVRGELAQGGALNDFRGQMPVYGAIEQSSQGWAAAGSTASQTTQATFDFVNGRNHVSHFMWARNEEVGTTEQRWYAAGTERPGGILDLIGYPTGTYGGVVYSAKTGQPLTYTNRPTGY